MFYRSTEGGLMIRLEDVSAIFSDVEGLNKVVLKSGFKLVISEKQAQELANCWR